LDSELGYAMASPTKKPKNLYAARSAETQRFLLHTTLLFQRFFYLGFKPSFNNKRVEWKEYQLFLPSQPARFETTFISGGPSDE